MNLSNKIISLTAKDNNNLYIKTTGYNYCYHLLQLTKDKIRYNNYFIKSTPIFGEYSHTNNHELSVVAQNELGDWITLPISSFLANQENPLEGIEYTHSISSAKIYSKIAVKEEISDIIIQELYRILYVTKKALDIALAELDNHYNILISLKVIDKDEDIHIVEIEYNILTLKEFAPYLPKLLDMDKLVELATGDLNKVSTGNDKPTIN